MAFLPFRTRPKLDIGSIFHIGVACSAYRIPVFLYIGQNTLKKGSSDHRCTKFSRPLDKLNAASDGCFYLCF